MTRWDILFGYVEPDAYDLLIEGGDFVIGNSQAQHTWHIIEANQGDYKQFPLVGIGVRRMLNAALSGNEKWLILKQLEGDEIRPERVVMVEGKILVKL
jgi:hypothetical protein